MHTPSVPRAHNSNMKFHRMAFVDLYRTNQFFPYGLRNQAVVSKSPRVPAGARKLK